MNLLTFILSKRLLAGGIDKYISKLTEGKVEYMIKWENYDDKDNTWESEENVYCHDLVMAFNASNPGKNDTIFQSSSFPPASSPPPKRSRKPKHIIEGITGSQ